MKTASPKPGTGMVERRREERVPAQGEVFIHLQGPQPVLIIAHLKDVSTGGFRASHSSPLLESGQQVRFNHDRASGTARVAWNRSVEGQWESGFFIVE